MRSTICEWCTLENHATALVCEACQAPLLHQAMKGKAIYVEDDTGTLVSWNFDEKACHRCSFLNYAHARTCGSCGGAFTYETRAPVIDVDDDDDGGTDIEIECQSCTLPNKAGCHVCSACGASLNLRNQLGGASSSYVAEGSTRAKTVCGNEKACFRCMFVNDGLARACVDCGNCFRCMFVNDRLATACVACGNSFNDTDVFKLADADDNENDEIECKTCTLLNKAGAHVCGACSTPLNSYHDTLSYSRQDEGIDGAEVGREIGQSFALYSGASSSHDPIDSTGVKIMCQKCTLWNAVPAIICARCNSDLTAESKVTEEQKIVCQACKGEFGSKSSGYELMRCNHGFCKPCLWGSVAEHLRLLTENNHSDLPDGFDMECPVEGCGSMLSREDLRLVVGPDILGLLDEWRMAVLTHKVIEPLICHCPHCKELSMFPSHQLHSLDRILLCKALQCNGLSSPSKQFLPTFILAQQLRGAASNSFWLCSGCFLVLCQGCGAILKLAPTNDTAHQCDPSLKQCFDIARSITKLCSAYVQATHSQVRKTHKRRGISASSLNQPMQGSRVSPSVDDEGLISEKIISSILDKGLQGMFEVEGTDAQGQEIEVESDDKVDIDVRKRRMASVMVDKHACRALQELTSSILIILHESQGALSPSLIALLCSHDLPYMLLKWLVRNDSIIDITARSSLYWELLSLMRALSNSPDLLPLFCNPEATHDCWAARSRCETPGSIMSDFEKLFKQAQFVLQRGEHLLLFFDEKDDKGKSISEQQDGVDMASLVADVVTTFDLLCRRIKVWEGKTSQHQWLADTVCEQHLAAAGRSERKSMPDNEGRRRKLLYFIAQRSSIIKNDSARSPSTPSISTKHLRWAHTKLKKSSCAGDDLELECDAAAPPSVALVEAYKAALRPFQFDEGRLLPTHYFRMQVGNGGAMMLNKRRARAISEELTQLNTTLPLEWESSIFLRMDEQRSDVLRALIIGPKGTPYENGVFLFDLLLEESYPETPPQVQFLTTGAGKVRFNPNLYECGKVCLSLLGTWQGPGWKAGESTIMQVLVSIQALVLVEDPYYNEPGYEPGGNQEHAEIYLHEQRLNTVLHSMLPTLRAPDPLFLRVIHSHFRIKAPHIIHQCNTWIEQESCSSIKRSLQSSFKELCLELNKLTSAPLP